MDSPLDKAQEIRGWMSPEELAWLYETAQQMTSIVELGCHRGRSTYVLCSGCQGPVYAIDCHWCGTMHPFEGSEVYTYPEFMANVGHFPNLVPFEGHFADFVASELIPAKFDMVFVDGDHAEFSMLEDLRLWAHRARKMVCGHDFDAMTPGVEAALQKFYGMQGVQRGPGKIWFIKKGE